MSLDAHVGAAVKEMYDDRFRLGNVKDDLETKLLLLRRSSVDPLGLLRRGRGMLSCTSM